MKQVITSQAELDKIPLDLSGEIVITGGTVYDPINLREYYKDAEVILSGNAVVSMFGKSQVKEMWGSSQVNVMRESSQVNVMWESSQVKEMWGSSQVNVMWGSSQVKEMWGSSQVKEMWGSSQVKEMWGSSQVNVMRESSQVNVMWESSQVKEMWGSSQVKEMWGSGLIGRVLGYNNKISCFGFNYVFLPTGADTSGITLNDTSQIIHFDSFKTRPDIEFYLKNYPIKEKEDGILIMYKAVHKTKDGEYVSNYNKNFKYAIGEVKTHEVSTDLSDSCSTGLHVGHLMFATDFGRGWESLAILELEVPKDKIVVSHDCDGKVRTSDLKVIRELDIEEYKHLL